MNKAAFIIFDLLLVFAGFCAGRTYEHYRVTQSIVEDIHRFEADREQLIRTSIYGRR